MREAKRLGPGDLGERIQRRIVDVRLEHAFAQVVEDDHPYRTTQSTECFLVQFGPDLTAGMKGEQADRFAAVAQCHHEQAHPPVLARYRITNHGAVAIVHLTSSPAAVTMTARGSSD